MVRARFAPVTTFVVAAWILFPFVEHYVLDVAPYLDRPLSATVRADGLHEMAFFPGERCSLCSDELPTGPVVGRLALLVLSGLLVGLVLVPDGTVAKAEHRLSVGRGPPLVV